MTNLPAWYDYGMKKRNWRLDYQEEYFRAQQEMERRQTFQQFVVLAGAVGHSTDSMLEMLDRGISKSDLTAKIFSKAWERWPNGTATLSSQCG